MILFFFLDKNDVYLIIINEKRIWRIPSNFGIFYCQRKYFKSKEQKDPKTMSDGTDVRSKSGELSLLQ